MIKNNLFLFAVCLFLSLSGCGGSDTNQLLENRQKWENLNIDSYQFQSKISCFCPSERQLLRNVLIINGQVSSIAINDTGKALRTEDETLIRSIDALFDLIALEESRAETLVVEYHPTLGYPTLISVDGNRQISDDEYSVIIEGLQLERDTVCSASVEPGFILNLIDKTTQEAINCDVTVTAKEDDFVETVTRDEPNCVNNQKVAMLYERQGFYQITIEKEGYATVELEQLGIARNLCHVFTNTTSIELLKN